MMTAAYLLLWVSLAGHLFLAERRLARNIHLTTVSTTISWLALTAGLAWRAVAAGHWPLANRYEFALCFVWL